MSKMRIRTTPQTEGDAQLLQERNSAKESEALVRLQAVGGFGPLLLGRLIQKFGSARRVLDAPPHLLATVQGIGADRSARVRRARSADADRQPAVRRCHDADVTIIHPRMSRWPEGLDSLSPRPAFLWSLGHPEALERPKVAIVGTRRATPHGRRTAHRLAWDLAKAGVCIVSGMAIGIDAAAHQGALDAGGTTVGILGSGIDRIYPPENRRLAKQIEDQGCLLSELPPHAAPHRSHFPVRNRLIAALGLVFIVVEAFPKAGSLITAREGQNIGRDVFIVPGRLEDEASKGANEAIRDNLGQILISTEQVVEHLSGMGVGLEDEKAQKDGAIQHPTEATDLSLFDLMPLEEAILAAIGDSDCHIDQLERVFGSDNNRLWEAVLRLECDGLIRSIPGNRYEISGRISSHQVIR